MSRIFLVPALAGHLDGFRNADPAEYFGQGAACLKFVRLGTTHRIRIANTFGAGREEGIGVSDLQLLLSVFGRVCGPISTHLVTGGALQLRR